MGTIDFHDLVGSGAFNTPTPSTQNWELPPLHPAFLHHFALGVVISLFPPPTPVCPERIFDSALRSLRSPGRIRYSFARGKSCRLQFGRDVAPAGGTCVDKFAQAGGWLLDKSGQVSLSGNLVAGLGIREYICKVVFAHALVRMSVHLSVCYLDVFLEKDCNCARGSRPKEFETC